MRWFLSWATAFALCAPAPAAAASLTVVLGDSLSDPCNLWNLDPSAVPNPPYPDKQFTNGNTWATQLGSNCASGANFAYGGATAVAADTNPVRGLDTLPSSVSTPTPNVPDLKEQAESFKISPLGQSPDVDFIAIWIGANDLFNTLETSVPIDLPIALAETTAAVVSTVTEVVEDLAMNGPPNAEFVLFGLPSLGTTPLINVLPEPIPTLMNLATGASNDELEEVARLFQLAGTPISYFDIEFFFDQIISDPSAFGFVNATDSCLDNPLCGTVIDPNSYLFYDKVHPSEAGHKIVLSEYKALTGVPLPAGLPLYLAGLALVPLVARRRSARVQPS